MILIFSAYRKFLNSKRLESVFIVIFLAMIISSALSIQFVNTEIQELFITILSILFPLIAGFLTFGKDTISKLKNQILNIQEKDRMDKGVSTTDTNKKQISRLKVLSEGFMDVILNVFLVSFILIILLLVSKFNNYEFISFDEESFLMYLVCNWLSILLKSILFFLLYSMFFSTLYLVIFIFNITKYDNLIK